MPSPAVHALAGSVGSVVAQAIFYPLYVATLSIQAHERERRSTDAETSGTQLNMRKALSDKYNKEGLEGVFRGLQSCLIAAFVQSGVYYYWFSAFKKLQHIHTEPLWNMLAGAQAGVATVLMTNPLWVINSREITKQTNDMEDKEDHDSFWQALQRLLQEEGVAGLYSGVVPALILVINPAVLFLVYTALCSMVRRLRRLHYSQPLPSLDILLIGGVSKLTSTVVSFPIQTIKVCLQKTQRAREVEFHGVWDAVTFVWRESGFWGFYRGIRSKLIQTVLCNAALFVLREKLTRLFHRMLVRN